MTENDDDFKHTTQSIYNQLDESQMKYEIYFIKQNDEKTTANQQQNSMDYIYQQLIDYIEQQSATYIWNRDKFSLANKPTVTQDGNYLIEGIVDYGDNVDDEWFIVHLLYKATAKFAGALAAQLYDCDGQFLLVHAAHHLPAWASSAEHDCTHNRVFIYRGQLHLLPPASTPALVTYLPQAGRLDNAFDALLVLRDFEKMTRASDAIQKCIATRLSDFGSLDSCSISTSFQHRATCLVPAKLAWLLKTQPSLLSSAVNRFCDKDPQDLRLCRTLESFEPVDMVDYRVCFTKHLYSKLKYCEFKPDKRHKWPPTTAADSTVREQSLLGFKLTCAFEIMSKQQESSNNSNKKSFDKYLERLKSLGYFKEYMEGSVPYNQLLAKARQDYKKDGELLEEDKDPFPHKDETSQNDDKRISTLLQSLYEETAQNDKYMERVKEEIRRTQEHTKDDSDEWLCVEAPQLDDYLEMYSRGDVSSTHDFGIISNAFKRFVQHKSAAGGNGVDYKPIVEKEDATLVDFNLDAIESNIKELLLNKGNKSKDMSDEENEDDDDEENDSFYEVDNDEFDENSTDPNTHLNLKTYMQAMDEELGDRQELSRLKPSGDADKEEIDEEMNIDLNLVSNALESYSSQLGLTGPVSNILKSLGI